MKNFPINKKDQIAADFNSYFPYKVCINLDRRPERWSRMQELFARNNINAVERFAALDGLKTNVSLPANVSRGAYGCLQSHLSVVRRAGELGAPVVLIFEDDCCFDEEFNDKFLRYIKQLPSDWDMLWFGGMHLEEPVMISKNIARLKSTCLLHAYALKSSLYDAFIALCEPAQEPIDLYTLLLQEKYNCYGFVPDLIWQAWDIGYESDVPEK